MDKSKQTFRHWLNQQWYEHCAEFEGWFGRQPHYDLKDYFQRYRWWLRREYQHQQGEHSGS
jgi:hypothetical protein